MFCRSVPVCCLSVYAREEIVSSGQVCKDFQETTLLSADFSVSMGRRALSLINVMNCEFPALSTLS